MFWIVLSVLTTLNPRKCHTNLPKLVERCVGEDVTITPDFVGYPSDPVVDWTNIPRDEEDEEGGIGRHQVFSNGTLVIRNVQESDSDLYSYLVHSEEEFTLSFFNLSVTLCSSNLVYDGTEENSGDTRRSQDDGLVTGDEVMSSSTPADISRSTSMVDDITRLTTEVDDITRFTTVVDDFTRSTTPVDASSSRGIVTSYTSHGSFAPSTGSSALVEGERVVVICVVCVCATLTVI